MLGQPEFDGPLLSVCSVGVQFSNLVPGATVLLEDENNAPIGEWPANRAVQAFNFPPGPGLTKTGSVRAKQYRPGEDGIYTNWVTVFGPPTPADLDKGSFATPLFECGQCVWLYGLFPGARVQIHRGKEVDESVVRPDGTAQVGLSTPIGANEVLKAIQIACPAQVKSPNGITSPAATPTGHAKKLPQTVVGPVMECATYLTFDAIMGGSSVKVKVTPQVGNPLPYGPACIPAAPYTLWGFQPFRKTDQIEVDTRLNAPQPPYCNRAVGNPVHPQVLPGPPVKPHVHDICPDAQFLWVGNLALNALVEIVYNEGQTPNQPTLRFGAPGDNATFWLSIGQPGGIPPLKEKDILTVRQNLCGTANGASEAAHANVLSTAPVPPGLFNPSFDAQNETVTPIMSWDDKGTMCNKATAYDLQIGTNPNLNPPYSFYSPAPIGSSQFDMPANILQYATKYYWRVRSYNKNMVPSMQWSDIWYFTTEVDPTGGQGGGPTGDVTLWFCEVCSGGSKTSFSETASDYATAVAKAMTKTQPDCLLFIGKCS
jgi:hypothetical protein